MADVFQFEGCASESPRGPPRTPVPFKIHVSDELLGDLATRLAQTRFPDELTDAGWTYGSNLQYMKSLVDYWKNSYNWRQQEIHLNEYDHFKMYIPETDINLHYVYVKSPRADAKPLLFLHGWPGSFYEAWKLIPLLTKPKSGPAFHMIVPSLPGYGFSSAPKRKGFGVKKVADTVHQLMFNLGYKTYYAQGGDWGSSICRTLGLYYPKNCLAIHINLCIVGHDSSNWIHRMQILELKYTGPLFFLSKEDYKGLNDASKFNANGGELAYQAIQGTKPQTLGYGLTDSRSITSSTRLYYESIGTGAQAAAAAAAARSAGKPSGSKKMPYVTVPTGVANFPNELSKPPKNWVESYYNLKHWSVHERGGHFGAMENPEALAKDVQTFISKL
ncbi:microsomal epoxide hydrolase [Synchytrium microbalum]|uniref:Microsomal epoxide hydrolase n=1 Tax=Synchytrium microbalum TaxID=1806994 RepID=A0A507C5R0_9FUNG|nr:microsomal epoxide hydrolase [Synchytrium microbalum]TPX34698.1 microsomal epoxide hydrolase [Synchytrium microbalum]